MITRTTRKPTSPKQDDLPKAHVFDAGTFTTLAVHDDLKLVEDRREFNLQFHEGARLARNLLRRGGMGRKLGGDAEQGGLDAMQDLCEKLRRAEAGARAARPLVGVSSKQLIQHISMLCVERGEVEDTMGSSGPQLMAAMKELTHRLMHTTPTLFVQQVVPLTPQEVAHTVLLGRRRLAPYTTAALINLCRSQLRVARGMQTELLDETHHEKAEEHFQRRSSAVMSPHMRGVVVVACGDALEALKRLPMNKKLGRDLPFIEAAIKVLPLLLDTPDHSAYSLARLLLVQQGWYSDQEIHRGLAAAKRHPLVQEVCKRIERGSQWQH